MIEKYRYVCFEKNIKISIENIFKIFALSLEAFKIFL